VSDSFKRLELLAFRLHIYGPEAADRAVIRSLARSTYWLETRNLLRSHEFTEAEIALLMGIHRVGCPCWRCVLKLNKAIRNRLKRASLASRGRKSYLQSTMRKGAAGKEE
jgi:hypothetical protein